MKRIRFYTGDDCYMGWANLKSAIDLEHWLHSGNYFMYKDEKITDFNRLLDIWQRES